jgi:hypothetical protein
MHCTFGRKKSPYLPICFDSESIVEEDFFGFKSFGRKKVLFFGEVVGGLGDISLVIKIANLMCAHLKTEQVFIAIYGAKKEEIELFNTKKFILIDPTQIEDLNNSHTISVNIITASADRILRKKMDSLSYIFFEYGRNFASKNILQKISFGIESKDSGIFISPELVSWGLDERVKAFPSYRLRPLLETSLEVQKAIFGEEEPSLEKFENQSSLYFGYSHNPLSVKAFSNAIMQFVKDRKEEPPKENIIICIPISCESFKEFLEKNSYSFELNGFKKLIIKTFTGDVLFRINSDELKSTPTIQIIVGRIPHSDYLSLLKASEKLSIAEGDQSVSEAISAQKHFVYEMLLHKEDFGLSLNRIFKRVSRIEIGYDFSYEDFWISYPSRCLSFASSEISQRMFNLFKMHTADPSRFDRFNSYIISEKDVSRKLSQLLLN